MEKEYKLINGNSLDILKTLEDNSVDSIVTDPPYELGFMGKSWDSTGIAFNVNIWKECLRVLKPGGHILAFSGSRTYHRMAVSIEDAGFEIRDQIMWVYGSGFPKSHNISKAIDKKAGVTREVIGVKKISGMNAERENFGANDRSEGKGMGFRAGEISITTPMTEEAKKWDGWGTALKPAHEPIVLARKPISEKTVTENVLKYGTGGLNIDACKIGNELRTNKGMNSMGIMHDDNWKPNETENITQGRFPANFIHDGLEEEWSRFFYCAKASKKDRDSGLTEFEEKPKQSFNTREEVDGIKKGMGSSRETAYKNTHPTVKPTDLMSYLCRLITPPNGLVLDPFNGSGSTGKSAIKEGFRYIGIDLSQEYLDISKSRIEHELSKKYD